MTQIKQTSKDKNKIYKQQIKVLLEQGYTDEEIIELYLAIFMTNEIQNMIDELRSKYYFKKNVKKTI